MKKQLLVLVLISMIVGGGFLTFSSSQKKETETNATANPTVTEIKEYSQPVFYNVIFDGENWNVVNYQKVETGKAFSADEIGIVADLGTSGIIIEDNGRYSFYFESNKGK